MFGVEDFFGVGLGVDIAGAYLLAAGLLSSVADIRTSSTFAGAGAQRTVQQIRNKVDATAGIIYLGVGFLLQIAGHAATAAGVAAGDPSAERALIFGATTATSLLVALFVHWIRGGRRTRALARSITYLDGQGLPLPLPSGRDLMELGIELGDDALEGETYGQYAARIWNIPDVSGSDDGPENHGRSRSRQAGRARPRRLLRVRNLH